jgi:hypothetical protein
MKMIWHRTTGKETESAVQETRQMDYLGLRPVHENWEGPGNDLRKEDA